MSGLSNGKMILFGGVFDGRRVLLTGHTGFKGSWLAFWLIMLGARVTGYALKPSTRPSLFDELRLADSITHVVGDIRDFSRLKSVFDEFQPEIVFHLAAQPLVRYSYLEPRLTYETNVMGTVNMLEAARACKSVGVIVNVTSDKCYESQERDYSYCEEDPMGGYDPYSSSKGCAELVTATYRKSFFGSDIQARLASARAGNVVGGGDWAEDRLIPDCVRSLSQGRPISVRNPGAVRPWQHVLEPLAGYLHLASAMWQSGHRFDGSWNFGPDNDCNVQVRQVVEMAISTWGSGSWQVPESGAAEPHETHLLILDCTKAKDELGLQPVYDIETTLRVTIEWYKAFYSRRQDMASVTLANIHEYVDKARDKRSVWTT